MFARLALLALLPGVHASAQDLLVNGSFEQGPNPGSFALQCPPSTSIVGWTVTRDCVHYCGTIWQCAQGVRSIDLDGLVGDSGGVSQTFATTPGAVYRATFAMAGNVNSGPAIKRMMVRAGLLSGEGTQSEFTFDITGRTNAAMGWSRRSMTFTAPSASTTLEFWSITSPAGWGPAIDDVAVRCAADVNADGFLDFFDYDDYVTCFETGVCPPDTTADFNGDGFVDFFDYDDFVAAFEAGC